MSVDSRNFDVLNPQIRKRAGIAKVEGFHCGRCRRSAMLADGNWVPSLISPCGKMNFWNVLPLRFTLETSLRCAPIFIEADNLFP